MRQKGFDAGCWEYHRVARRDFLEVGAVSAIGLSMTDLFRLQAQADSKPKKDISCIMVWLRGGPSSIDMWDLKPDAPSTHRGEFNPISTNVPGIQISEHFPLTAKQADKFCLVRSVTHPRGDHGGGSHYMATGWNTAPQTDYPSYGCVIADQLGPRGPVPPHVHLPEPPKYTGRGFLSAALEPFVIATDRDPDLPTPDLKSQSVRVRRFERRRALRDVVDDLFREADAIHDAKSMGKFYEDAYTILSSRKTRDAFDLTKEPPSERERYGLPKPLDKIVLQGNDISKNDFNSTIVGQGLLLARRLVEAGVRFVTVVGRGWDTHDNNFNRLKDILLPPLDRGLSALLADLHERGMLDSTIVMVTGDFNRTPKINAQAGRDHWPHVQTVFLAGGGIRGGQVYGASDAKGEYPGDKPVKPERIAAMLYQLFGIDTSKLLYSFDGRPHKIV